MAESSHMFISINAMRVCGLHRTTRWLAMNLLQFLFFERLALIAFCSSLTRLPQIAVNNWQN
jgi:hypothetical protein